MPQQINLYSPVLVTQKQYFSATVMVQALAALTLVGAAYTVYEMSSLRSRTEAMNRTLATQAQALAALQQTIVQRKAATVPAGLTLAQDLQARRADLLHLERAQAQLQRGLFRPGEGHAARLALVASSIPAAAWVTGVKADPERLEVSGFTLDPDALNGWIDQLAGSALLTGQRLAAVNVAKVTSANPASANPINALPEPARPVWSFSLVSSLDKPVTQTGGAR